MDKSISNSKTALFLIIRLYQAHNTTNKRMWKEQKLKSINQKNHDYRFSQKFMILSKISLVILKYSWFSFFSWFFEKQEEFFLFQNSLYLPSSSISTSFYYVYTFILP